MKKNLRKNLRNRKGFTLVELIVVMIVIAILAMMLIPQMASFRTRAEQSTCMANLRMLDSIDGMWLGLDINNRGGGTHLTDNTLSGQQSYVDAGLLKKIYACPTDGEVYTWNGDGTVANYGNYECPTGGEDPDNYPHSNEAP